MKTFCFVEDFPEALIIPEIFGEELRDGVALNGYWVYPLVPWVLVCLVLIAGVVLTVRFARAKKRVWQFTVIFCSLYLCDMIVGFQPLGRAS